MKKNMIVVICLFMVFIAIGGYLYKQDSSFSVEKAQSTLPSGSPSLSTHQPSEVDDETEVSFGSNETMTSSHVVMSDAVLANFQNIINELNTLFSQRESSDTLTIEEQRRLNQLKEELIIYASNNPLAFDEIISLYRADPVSDLGGFLYNVLAQFDKEKVINLASELTYSSEREVILAGLNLLSEINASNSGVYHSIERVFSLHASDNELILSAISALPNTSPSDVDVTPVLKELESLINNEDGAIRSESIFSIGRLAKDPEALSVVLDASKSQDLDDRRSVAMALNNSSLVSDDILNHLIERMGDNKEEWEIRRLSADSLNRFDLSSAQEAAYQRFSDEEERIVHLR